MGGTLKKKKMIKYDEAVAKVEEFLQQFCKGDLKAKVYDYLGRGDTLKERPFVGVRVAEVSFFNDRGGCSFMQSDVPEGLAMCAQVERCILATIEDWDADGNGDGEEECERLRYLMTEPVKSKKGK
jgi:hypothetical protein